MMYSPSPQTVTNLDNGYTSGLHFLLQARYVVNDSPTVGAVLQALRVYLGRPKLPDRHRDTLTIYNAFV